MYDEVYQHQVNLERLKAGLLRDLAKHRPEVRALISKAIMEYDEYARLNDMTQADLRDLMTEIKLLQGDVYGEVEDRVLSDLEQLAENEAVFEAKMIELAPASAVQAWRKARRTPIQATGEMLEPFIKDLGKRNIKRVENELRTSIAQGRTLQETIIALNGRKKNGYRDGVLGRNWRDAEAVIRTAVQHTSQQGRSATWAVNDVKRYVYIATLDGRTSDVCRSLDNRAFEVGDGPVPPIHVRCRSTTVPDIDDPGGTRSSMDGYVDGDTTYYQWLKSQPAEFQDDVLGPTRAKLFRDGGLSADDFAKLQLDKNFRPLSLDEMAKKEPSAFKKAGIDGKTLH